MDIQKRIFKVIEACLRSGRDTRPTKIYLGHEEYAELFRWASLYSPQPIIDASGDRPKFEGCQLYLVNSESHITVV